MDDTLSVPSSDHPPTDDIPMNERSMSVDDEEMTGVQTKNREEEDDQVKEEQETNGEPPKATEEEKKAALGLYQIVLDDMTDEDELLTRAETIILKEVEILRRYWNGDELYLGTSTHEEEDSDSKTYQTFIHLVCSLDRIGFVKLFLQYLNKEDISILFLVPDSEGYSPLNYAVMNENEDLVKLILEHNPGAAQVPSQGQGLLPLHQAQTLPIIELLTEVFPDGVKAKDALGSLPLHRILQHRYEVSLPILEFLIDAYPESLSMPDNTHHRPIEYVIKNDNEGKVSEASLRFMIERWPEALEVRDVFGRRLLNTAANKVSSSDSLRFDGHARNLKIIFEEGIKYGYYSAEEGGGLLDDTLSSSLKDLYALFSRAMPNIDRETQNPKPTPLECFVRITTDDTEKWTKWCTIFEKANEMPFLHALIQDYDFFWKYVPTLVEQFDFDLSFQDSKGRTALIVAIHALTSCQDPPPSSYSIIEATLRQTESNNTSRGTTSTSSNLVKDSISPANMQDESGRYPLHIACEQGLDWKNGTQNILYENISALEICDPISGLHPSLLAAVGDKYDTATIFELLRAKPDVLA